jgi:hypothetical protein
VLAYTSEPPPTPAPESTSTRPSNVSFWIPWQPSQGSHRYRRRSLLVRGKGDGDASGAFSPGPPGGGVYRRPASTTVTR